MLVLGDPALVEFKGGLIRVLNALDVPAGPLIVSKKRDPDATRLLVEGNRSAQERQEVSEPLLRDTDLEVQHDTDGAVHVGEDRRFALSSIENVPVPPPLELDPLPLPDPLPEDDIDDPLDWPEPDDEPPG